MNRWKIDGTYQAGIERENERGICSFRFLFEPLSGITRRVVSTHLMTVPSVRFSLFDFNTIVNVSFVRCSLSNLVTVYLPPSFIS